MSVIIDEMGTIFGNIDYEYFILNYVLLKTL